MGQPQFTIKTESNKAFDETCLIGTFEITNGNIADCLEHCLENCSCRSFQICQNTCQLCSCNKEDNSSLLRDKNNCVYARLYEMRQLTESFQKVSKQCSGMSCFLKYNCCQQSYLCPENKICKPLHNITQPWKRFTCECPDGYHGDNCDEPIRSCRGYSNSSHQSGIYKVLDSLNSTYQVYCDLDSDGAWTMVQSYSLAKYTPTASNTKFKAQLSKDEPVNENAPQWSEYRLSKKRMQSIQKDSFLRLRFTCDYEKDHDAKNSDYVELLLREDGGGNEETIDVFQRRLSHQPASLGKVRGIQLDGCKIRLEQFNVGFLHVDIEYGTDCKLAMPPNPRNCKWFNFNYFGKYRNDCLDKEHRCAKNDNSTTQLWFGN